MARRDLPLVSHERLIEALYYCAETGNFTWLISSSRRVSIGSTAGCVCPIQGYWLIGLDGKLYRAHRLAWMYMTGQWPTLEIDHADNNRSNNQWRNLRLVTRKQNEANKRIGRRNTSGYKGVSLIRATGRWAAFIGSGGKTKSLGTFNSPQEAHLAYCTAINAYHGVYGRSQ